MANTEKSQFTRRELYDRVWKEPMVNVAKAFGLSDRGLAKICERNGIPVPPRGYWAKKVVGKRVVRPPLLDVSGSDQSRKIEIGPYWRTTRSEEKQEEKAEGPDPFKELWDRELQDIKPIHVPETLRNPHRIIAGWIEDDRRDREYWAGRGYRPADASTEKSAVQKRRLRILNSLLKALEARGFVVEQEHERGRSVLVRFEHDKVGFDLSELIRQQRRKLTDEEKQERGTNQSWTQTREPTGILVLTISSMPRGVANSWRDEPEAPLEQKLHLAVVGFIVSAAYVRECRKHREEAEHKRWLAAEEARRREEERRAEIARKKAMRSRARAWHLAADIRSYVGAVRQAAAVGSLSVPPEELDQWAEWALAHANEIDPIATGEALSLEPAEIEGEESPPQQNRYSYAQDWRYQSRWPY